MQFLQSVYKDTTTYVNSYIKPPQGKVYLVTGASQGIGKAIAHELGRQGKALVLVARNEKKLLEVKEDIAHKYNVPVITICFDVTDFDGYQKLFATAQAKLSSVDTIILNAGTFSAHKVGKTGFLKDISVLETNLLAPISCINEFVANAKQHKIKNPHIVVITSIAAEMPSMQAGAYGASKSGLTKYVESCALELESEGFYFTNIQPGFIATDLSDNAIKGIFKYACIDVEWCAKETVYAINRRQRQRYIPHWLYFIPRILQII